MCPVKFHPLRSPMTRPSLSTSPVLYFRHGDEPAAGLIVTNGVGDLKLRTDELGRIVGAPRKWTRAGTRLHVLLRGKMVEVEVKVSSTDGLPLPIQVPVHGPGAPRAGGGMVSRARFWCTLIVHHWIAVTIVTLGIAVGSAAIAWFGIADGK